MRQSHRSARADQQCPSPCHPIHDDRKERGGALRFASEAIRQPTVIPVIIRFELNTEQDGIAADHTLSPTRPLPLQTIHAVVESLALKQSSSRTYGLTRKTRFVKHFRVLARQDACWNTGPLSPEFP